MDLYNVIASWIGWPLVAALFIVLGGYGYWVLNKRIEALQQHINFLQEKNKELENYKPDVLAKRLADRHKLLTEEIERMNIDAEANKTLLELKEKELSEIRTDIAMLQLEISSADDILKVLTPKYTCPHCGSLLETHSFYPMETEDKDGRSIDWEIEETTFECGLIIRDGEEVSLCKNNITQDDR